MALYQKTHLAGIFNNNADIVSRVAKNTELFAPKCVIFDFLPISAPFAGFRCIDFPQ
jgi:hypothetical protein